jgi:chromosome partitioning protein
MRIAVASLKGGTGKTITAVHLAAGLTTMGPTLLIDADRQLSAYCWSRVAGAGFPFPVVPLSVWDIHRRLPGMSDGYAHVVLDTPPGEVEVIRSALLASEVVVVPLAPAYMDLNRLEPTLDLIAEVEEAHPLKVLVLMTRVRAGTKMARIVRAHLAELEVPTLQAEIPLREAYTVSFGAPPAPHVDYAAVLTEILARRSDRADEAAEEQLPPDNDGA